MFKVHPLKVHIFVIPKCLQQQENVDTNEVGITVVIIIFKLIQVLLKMCSNCQYSKKMVKCNGIEACIEVEMVVIYIYNNAGRCCLSLG